MFWNRFPDLSGIRLRAHFNSCFSKRRCEPTKFKYCSFAQECEILQQGPLCLRILLGVSLSFLERVLGRTYIFAYGDASGFFVFRCCLVRRKYKLSTPEAAMLLSIRPDSLQPVITGNLFLRQKLFAWMSALKSIAFLFAELFCCATSDKRARASPHAHVILAI